MRSSSSSTRTKAKRPRWPTNFWSWPPEGRIFDMNLFGGFCRAPAQPISSELILQGSPADAKRFGGFCAVAGHVSESLANEHFLDLGQRRSRTHREQAGISFIIAKKIRQTIDLYDRFRACDHQPLDDIAQLAHISR